MVKSPICTVRRPAEGDVTSASLRILHVTKRFHPFQGGVERYVEDLAVAQVQRGHRVRVLTMNRDLVGDDPQRLPLRHVHRGIEVLAVSAVGTARKQFATGHYGDILTSLRAADVVHHHDPRFLLELATATRRLSARPLILHTHGLIWHTDRYALIKDVVARWYYGPLFRNLVDVVIADSDADATRLAEAANVRGSKVRVLRNAIDLSRFSKIARAPRRGVVVSFGRLDTHKGLDRLLAALPTVSVPWQLRVAGTGPGELVSELQAQATALGVDAHVEWLGRLSDAALDDLLGEANLAVFPSRSEGFGLALLEALAAGVPVLASDIPSHREVLGPVLGHRVASFDDPVALAAAISANLSETDTDALAEAERARADVFGHAELVEAIEAIYVDLGLLPATQSSSTSIA